MQLWCSVLQCVAVVQCAAVCCTVLIEIPRTGNNLKLRARKAEVHCIVLLCVALCCSVLQCVAVCCSAFIKITSIGNDWSYTHARRQWTPCVAVYRSMSQYITVCRGVLQCVAVCCSVLIEMPSTGNDWSYAHARRQWTLADESHLRYMHLNNFDAAMHGLEEAFPFMHEGAHEYVSLKNDYDKMIVAERGDLLFIFNFHPSKSYQVHCVCVSVCVSVYLIFVCVYLSIYISISWRFVCVCIYLSVSQEQGEIEKIDR